MVLLDLSCQSSRSVSRGLQSLPPQMWTMACPVAVSVTIEAVSSFWSGMMATFCPPNSLVWNRWSRTHRTGIHPAGRIVSNGLRVNNKCPTDVGLFGTCGGLGR